MSARPLAFITGAARRVGKTLAIEFARAGYDLILTFNTSPQCAKETKQDCESLGSSVSLVQIDLNSDVDLDAIAGRVDSLDVLIHNASRYEPTPFGRITAQQMRAHYEINALAPIMLTQTLRDALTTARGSVIAMCDIHAMSRPRKNFTAYTMSKAALTQMVECLARELAPHVRVNGIAPGVILWPEDTPETEKQAYEKRIPLQRPGTPEETAATALYLAQKATYTTGQIIRLDGGRYLT